MSERAGAEVDIGRISCAALKAPERLSSAAVADVEVALGAGSSEARRMLALGALAAVLYTRHDLIGRSTVRALGRMIPSPGSPVLTEAAARTLSLFAGSAAAPAASSALTALLVRRRLPRLCRVALLKSLAVHARWHPGSVALDAALRVAHATSDGVSLDLVLSEIVEPLISRMPRELGAATVDRLIRIFDARPRFRYVLAGLAERRGLPPAMGLCATHAAGIRLASNIV